MKQKCRMALKAMAAILGIVCFLFLLEKDREQFPGEDIREEGQEEQAEETEEEQMQNRIFPENIRVALSDSSYSSLYHDEVRAFSETDMLLTYGTDEARKTRLVKAGRVLKLDAESSFLKEGSAVLETIPEGGQIKLLSLERTQGNPSYRGSLTVTKTEKGLVLINELSLEEYLYAVIPSEMPSSYPMEALKAQAVCARTYALQKMLDPGLTELGADLDDSVSFQVYNNIEEQENATLAVKETEGVFLRYGLYPADICYYSTSCGFGSLKHIGEEGTAGWRAEELSQEEVFQAYIKEVHEEDYEKEEGWYRWEYTVEEADLSLMAQRLGTSFHRLYNLTVAKRSSGGRAEVLSLETDAGTIEVEGEYNIRYVLCQGGIVQKQDGTQAETGKLLPSAYMIINVVKSKGNVVGYTVFGGGYGHGSGMSQNGAKTMAEKGMSCEDILDFFYPDCRIAEMKTGGETDA